MSALLAVAMLNIAVALFNFWIMHRNQRIAIGNEQVLHLQIQTLRAIERVWERAP